MKWTRRSGYGASRCYDAGPAAVGKFGLLAAWFGSIVSGKFRSRARAALFDGQALLSSDDESGGDGREAAPWAQRSSVTYDGHDWRVLP